MALQLTDILSNIDSEANNLDSSITDNLPSSSSICSKKLSTSGVPEGGE